MINTLKSVLFLLLSFYILDVHGQKAKTHVLTSDEAKTINKDAATMFASSDYSGALKAYLNLYKSDPKNVDYNYRLGFCYLMTSVDKKSSLKYLEFANESKSAKKEWIFYLALAYMYNEKWDEAIKSFSDYNEATHSKLIKDFLNPNRMIEMCKNGKELSAKPINCIFTNPGKTVNSSFEEYNPFISADGETLVFTSRRKGNMGGFIEDLGIYTSDLYSSVWKDTVWAKAKGMGANVNSEWDEESVGLSPLGDQVFIYFDNAEKFEDVGVASLKGKAWQKPVMLPEEINSKEYEGGACSSPDGSTIYFSSERKGTIGGFDLWMIKKDKNGKLGEAINLGKEINTKYDEDHPYLTADGKKLYFCSKGWNSMGGYDLFYLNWDEKNNKWSSPVNVGYPINDADDNDMISFTGDERFAYVTAVRPEGFGDKDVYKVEFLDTLHHPFNHILTGNCTGRVEIIKVTLENKTSAETQEFIPNVKSNQFVFAAKPGEYRLKIEGYNFLPYSEDVTIGNEYPPIEIKKVITLSPSK